MRGKAVRAEVAQPKASTRDGRRRSTDADRIPVSGTDAPRRE
jgi:hypothetical protein